MNKFSSPFMAKSPLNQDKKENSPLQKKGPCGGPNQPSCPDELKRMAEKQGYSKSYQSSMDVSNVGNMKQPKSLKGGFFMSIGNVSNAAQAETTKRISNLTNDPGYKAFTNNPNSTGIIRHVDNFIKSSSSARGKKAVNFQVPTKQEAGSLIDIGKKYIDSTDIMKDISFKDKLKAGVLGAKLAYQYPNILAYGEKSMKK